MASPDPARVLFECKTVYNTLHLYQVLELLDAKDELTDIARVDREAKIEQEREARKTR